MYLDGKKLLKKEIDAVYTYAWKIIDKGVVGEKNKFNLANILEIHQRIKIYLEELDYALSKDIPIGDVIVKTMSTKKAIVSEYKKLLGHSNIDTGKTGYLKSIRTILNRLYGEVAVKISELSNSIRFSIQMDEYTNDCVEELGIEVTEDGTVCIKTVILECSRDDNTQEYISYLQKLDNIKLNYDYTCDITENEIIVFTIIDLWHLEDTLLDFDSNRLNDLSSTIEECINNVLIDIQTIMEEMEGKVFDHLLKEEIKKENSLFGTDLFEKNIKYEMKRFYEKEKLVHSAFKATLIGWIKELQEFFSNMADVYGMESYLESELDDIIEKNDYNLELHYSMLIDRLDDILEQNEELRGMNDFIDLISEIKRWEEPVD